MLQLISPANTGQTKPAAGGTFTRWHSYGMVRQDKRGHPRQKHEQEIPLLRHMEGAWPIGKGPRVVTGTRTDATVTALLDPGFTVRLARPVRIKGCWQVQCELAELNYDLEVAEGDTAWPALKSAVHPRSRLGRYLHGKGQHRM